MMTHTKKNLNSRIETHVRNRLVSGVLVLVPLAITIFVLNLIFASLTAFVLPVLRPWLGKMPEYALTSIALVATVLVIYLVGLITTHIIGRRLIQWGEAVLLKLPIVKSVYSASKQVVDTFSASTKAAFKAVVLVEFPRAGSLAVGFITGTILNPAGKSLYRVFVPTTPNPTSGFLVILPEEEMQFTDISIEDGVKMIVSGGMLAPKRYAIEEKPPLHDDEIGEGSLPTSDGSESGQLITTPTMR